jgi:tetratricopeptide (TPR) repeat protein
MQLLSLDRNARPTSAGEVMERLSVVAELPLELGTEVSRAYLTTPILVGRDRALVAVRRQMLSLVRGDGGTLLIRGVAGSGRSRLLDACALEGKLLGATVVRADASAGSSADWSVARALGSQLLQLLPEETAEAARLSRDVLGYLLEGLRDDAAPVSAVAPERSLLIRELRDLVLALARSTRLLVVVDDADRIDEPSAALLAALAHKTDRQAVLLAVGIDSEADPQAHGSLRLLDDIAKLIEVEHLQADETEALMRSVFGDVANLSLCAGRIHNLSQGNPRAAMELAQHLVDRGLAHYDTGSWSLPAELNEGDLPSTLSAAWLARISTLGSDARELVEALALADDDRLPIESYAALTSHRDPRRLFKVLDELVADRILVADAERYYFAQRGILVVLQEAIPEARRLALHSRLADLLAGTGGDVVRRGHHLLCAQRDMEAIELLRGINLVERLPPLALLTTLVERAERYPLPARTLHELRIALLSKASVVMATKVFRRWSPIVLRQLEQDSGLACYAELGDLPHAERLQQALVQTRERYLATPEHERVHSVSEAIRELARISGSVTSMANPMYELEVLESLPSFGPLLGLSPALAIVELLLAASKQVVAGTGHRGIKLYRQVLERLEQPDRGGLDEAQYKRTRLGVEYAVGALEAGLGISIEQRALVLESDRELRVNAWRVRMLMHLNQGNTEEARKCSRRAELLRLQEGLEERYAASTLAGELLGFALLGDMLGIKSMFDALSSLSAEHPGWRPIQLYAQGRYRQLQGDLSGALEAIVAALALVQPTRHAFYCYIAAIHVDLLEQLGLFEQARDRAREYVAIVDQAELTVTKSVVYVAAAQVLARAGEHAEALALIEATMHACEQMGRSGFALGRLYEARARIAIHMQDKTSFDHFVERCVGEYIKAKNPMLGARLGALIEQAQGALGDASQPPPEVVKLIEAPFAVSEHDSLHSRMMECVDHSDRGRCALTLLLQSTESTAGYLFAAGDLAVELLAALPDGVADAALVRWTQQYIAAELTSGDTATLTAAADDETASMRQANTRYTDREGRSFEAISLMTEGARERRLIAVLALEVGPGVHLVPPRQLCSELAVSLHEHGIVGALLSE